MGYPWMYNMQGMRFNHGAHDSYLRVLGVFSATGRRDMGLLHAWDT